MGQEAILLNVIYYRCNHDKSWRLWPQPCFTLPVLTQYVFIYFCSWNSRRTCCRIYPPRWTRAHPEENRRTTKARGKRPLMKMTRRSGPSCSSTPAGSRFVTTPSLFPGRTDDYHLLWHQLLKKWYSNAGFKAPGWITKCSYEQCWFQLDGCSWNLWLEPRLNRWRFSCLPPVFLWCSVMDALELSQNTFNGFPSSYIIFIHVYLIAILNC